MRNMRKKRPAYRLSQRIGALMIASVMTVTNVGADLNVSFAGESGNDVTFVVRGMELVRSVREAVYDDREITPDDLEFTNGKTEKFEELFFGEGTVYEAFPEFDGDGDRDAELRVFVKLPEPSDGEEEKHFMTGDEELIFLYVNNGETAINCNTEIVSSADEDDVLKRTKKVKVKSFSEAFGDEEVEIITNTATSSNAKPVQKETAAAGSETSAETVTGDGETEKETEESSRAQADGEKESSSAAGEASSEEESQKSQDQETEKQADDVKETEKQADDVEETEKQADDVEEPQKQDDDGENSGYHDGDDPDGSYAGDIEDVQASVTRYFVPRVSSLEQSEESQEADVNPKKTIEETRDPEQPDDETDAGKGSGSKAEQAYDSSRAEQTEDSSKAEQTEDSSEAEQTEGSSEAEQAESGSKAEQAESSSEAEQAESGSKAEQTESGSEVEQGSEQAESSSRAEQGSSETETSGVLSETVKTATGSQAETGAPEKEKTENKPDAADGNDLAGIDWCCTGKVYFTTLNKLKAFDDVEGFMVDYVIEPDDDLAKIDGPVLLEPDEELYFTVEPEDGYTITSVTANGMELEPADLQEMPKKGPSKPGNAARVAEPEEDITGGPGAESLPVDDLAETASDEEEAEEVSEIRAYHIESVEENLEISVLVDEITGYIPAAEYHAETDEVLVNVSVPGGAFEEEVELKASKIVDEAQLNALEETVKSTLKQTQRLEEVVVYDVAFLSVETGEEIEPLLPVKVEMEFKQPLLPKSREAATEPEGDFSLIHISDQNKVEKVAEASGTEEQKFDFQLDSFSPIMLARILTTMKARIGEVEYKTVQDAIDDANNGDVIVLQRKCSSYGMGSQMGDNGENLKITGKELTLDLKTYELSGKLSGNNMVNGVESVITITKGGKLTIVGNGTVQANGNYRAITVDNSELVIGEENTDGGPKITGHYFKTPFDTYLTGDIKFESVNMGGVIFASGSNSSVVLNSGTITQGHVSASDDKPLVHGAGIAVQGGSFTMNGGVIENNYLITKKGIQMSEAYGYGAGIYLENGVLTLNGGTIAGNIAASTKGINGYNRLDGGGVAAKNAEVNIQGVTITENGASGVGGGLCLISCNADIQNSIISENESGYIAGIYLEDGELTLNGGRIAGNIATSTNVINGDNRLDGGGVAAKDAKVNIQDVTITENTTFGAGGGLCLIYCDADIQNSTISGNESYSTNLSYGGGGIYSSGYKKSVEIKKCQISGNKALGSCGGGIDATGNLTIRETDITGNSAKSYGGGVSAVGGFLNMEGGTVKENSTTSEGLESGGGGIYIRPSINSRAVFTGATVKNNTTNGYGGGIMMESRIACGIELGNSLELSKNTAKRGGGLCVFRAESIIDGEIQVQLTEDAALYGNTATDDLKIGGACASNEILLKGDRLKSLGTIKVSELLKTLEEGGNAVNYQVIKDSVTYKMMYADKTAEDYTHGYYHAQEIVKQDCVEKGTIYLDPLGDSVHFIWDEVKQEAVPMTKANGLCTTVQEAVELAKNLEKKTIHLCSQITLDAATAKLLDENQIIIERCSTNYKGNLLMVNGDVTLAKAQIDGAEVLADSSMIYVPSGAVLTIADNAVIKNASRLKGDGGAVYVNGGTLNVDGGELCNNKTLDGNGGAVYAFNANINIAMSFR